MKKKLAMKLALRALLRHIRGCGIVIDDEVLKSMSYKDIPSKHKYCFSVSIVIDNHSHGLTCTGKI